LNVDFEALFGRVYLHSGVSFCGKSPNFFRDILMGGSSRPGLLKDISVEASNLADPVVIQFDHFVAFTDPFTPISAIK
jgi:hypothetical protein